MSSNSDFLPISNEDNGKDLTAYELSLIQKIKEFESEIKDLKNMLGPVVKREFGEAKPISDKAMMLEINETREVAEKTFNAVFEQRKFKENHRARVLNTIRERVNMLLRTYENSAYNIIRGNLQGQLYKRYQVNRYEDMLVSNYTQILDEAKKWSPTGDVFDKLEEFRRPIDEEDNISNQLHMDLDNEKYHSNNSN